MSDSTIGGGLPDQGSTASGVPPRRAGFRPLRVWPAVFLVALMIAARYGPGLTEEGASTYWMISVFGPILCCLLLLIWWLAASRATWRERVFGFAGVIAAVALAVALADPSMRGAGTSYFTVPMGMGLFALTVILLKRSRPALRTGLAVLMALVGFGASALFRNEGMTGDYEFTLHSRWSQTPEERMLATARQEPSPAAAQPESGGITNTLAKPDWAGFRGADRDGASHAPAIATNWTAQPPQELWKTPVGPGWSSFAVAGGRVFTQEQRGPNEAVVCYDAESGREIWKAEFESRLEDPMGGPGPRATPTLADGALYAAGSMGAFLRLDPNTGQVVWKKELSEISGRAKPPMWGFSASPLVTHGLAIVYAGGPGDKGLLALDAGTGELRWSVATGSESYVSPQLNTIQGEEHVLMFCNDALLLVDPATGSTRLRYEWKVSNYRALQPHLVGGDTILLTTPMNAGTRAIRITKGEGGYAAEELWTSRHLKPDFADLVTYQGHVYGNDNGILTCLDLKTGQRTWKGGRYGKGQLLLLENSGLLLVAAEQGQVVLVRADPSDHVEVASFKALEGKTWNHPVVVGDHLFVRNSQEAAAYRLPLRAVPNVVAGNLHSPQQP